MGGTGRRGRGGTTGGGGGALRCVVWRVAHLAEVIGEGVVVVDDDDRAVRGGRRGDRARAARGRRPRPDRTPRRGDAAPGDARGHPRGRGRRRRRSHRSRDRECGHRRRPPKPGERACVRAPRRVQCSGDAPSVAPRRRFAREAVSFEGPIFENVYGHSLSLFLHTAGRRDPRWRRHHPARQRSSPSS